MRVSATEDLESPQEDTGWAGPVLSRRYWPSRPLRYRRWARISIKVVGSAHASTGASWQRRGTNWAPLEMSPEARARCVAT